ncbi:hypothetical protein [Microbacterium luticocti]|uniref:hypothetical protein n=1 Tax=Microbacterium luticocti TaxID=451764 RepID=UPI0003FDC9FD|nr:hypothetical protein [Microbacterium luticocti]
MIGDPSPDDAPGPRRRGIPILPDDTETTDATGPRRRGTAGAGEAGAGDPGPRRRTAAAPQSETPGPRRHGADPGPMPQTAPGTTAGIDHPGTTAGVDPDDETVVVRRRGIPILPDDIEDTDDTLVRHRRGSGPSADEIALADQTLVVARRPRRAAVPGDRRDRDDPHDLDITVHRERAPGPADRPPTASQPLDPDDALRLGAASDDTVVTRRRTEPPRFASPRRATHRAAAAPPRSVPDLVTGDRVAPDPTRRPVPPASTRAATGGTAAQAIYRPRPPEPAPLERAPVPARSAPSVGTDVPVAGSAVRRRRRTALLLAGALVVLIVVVAGAIALLSGIPPIP